MTTTSPASVNAMNARLASGKAAARAAMTRMGERAAAADAERAQLAARGWGAQFTTLARRDGNTTALTPVPGYLLEERAEPGPPPLPPGWPQQLPGRPAPGISAIASRCSTLNAARLTVSWPRFTGDVTATAADPGELKTESGLTFTTEVTILPFLSTWIGVGRGIWDDLGVLQTLVNGKLRRGLGAAIDDAIAATLAADDGIAEAAGADLAEAVRAAVLDLGASGYGGPVTVLAGPAAAAAVHPADVPAGTTLIATRALPADVAIAADLAACVLFASKGDPAIMISDSNADQFTRNELTLLAEIPAAGLVTDPGAARRIGDGTAARTAGKSKRAA